MMQRLRVCVLAVVLLTVGAARAEEDEMGAVVAPAAMPDGATSVYGYAGAPEVGAGFRQGIAGFEVEARARFNWFQVSGVLEVVGRREVWTQGPVSLAPTLGLGVVLNSGATYMEDDNTSGVLLRLSAGAVATCRVSETVSTLGLVELPFDLGLSPTGARRFQALAGGGAEAYVGGDLTVSAVGLLGVETFKAAERATDTSLGWAVRVGMGLRLF
ncbi:hypothetical protein P2318_11635 [Myxococcaceae bacterium GXIMD 01537]